MLMTVNKWTVMRERIRALATYGVVSSPTHERERERGGGGGALNDECV